ncbi:MAG: menaquinone biosynthesis protein [Planctomycetes bacterium]|nr:menaquinone biosynthesis protein [Planctomycetota bacterium]MCC7168835.1 menaquinone biosynthesis protein [Planctomycetota bacterium]
MTQQRLRVGSVPYLNARPLVEGLAAERVVDFREDVPSRLARELDEGRLDAALVSSVEALRHPERVIVPDLCIASLGPVLSVKVFGRDDVKRAKRVALDGASLTAAALTRIAYGRILERDDVEFVPVGIAPDPDQGRADRVEATLVIGDKALALDRAGAPAWDLGDAWTQWSGLPFVWAVWLARDEATAAALHPILTAAYERGRTRLDAYASSRPDLGVDRARHYLIHVMRYRLERAELEGLRRFDAVRGS